MDSPFVIFAAVTCSKSKICARVDQSILEYNCGDITRTDKTIGMDNNGEHRHCNNNDYFFLYQ